MGVRRCPTLPQGPPCSTIGAVSLSFRVRNVSGRFPDAMAAVTLAPITDPGTVCGGGGEIVRALLCSIWGLVRLLGTTQWTRVIRLYIVPFANVDVDSDYQVIGVLVPVSCTPCGASTSGLSTQSSGWAPLPPKDGNLILRPASRLDAFSGYPSRT